MAQPYRAAVVGLIATLSLAACERFEGEGPPALVIRNHFQDPYNGPLQFATSLPDGTYEGEGGIAGVEGGTARATVVAAASSTVVLTRRGEGSDRSADPYSYVIKDGQLELRHEEAGLLGRLAFGLAVHAGTSAGPADAVASFEPLATSWLKEPDGDLRGTAAENGYKVDFLLEPYDGGWLDVSTVIKREGGISGDAYVALLRRIDSGEVEDVRMRWNGRPVEGRLSPDYWERDFWYTRGVDWASWRSGGRRFLAVNAFAPSTLVLDEEGERKVVANHFYVWERVRAEADGLYLISEIAGPNPEQAKSRYMPVRPYTPPDDTIRLAWQLALAELPGREESQLHIFAGYRDASTHGNTTVVDLGVPHVAFGTSYFPYSTFIENFDYYRVPGVDKETWWPFSVQMWNRWRDFVPQMMTDLRIIKAMGFEWVRLHYLGHLIRMPRSEALAFLDFFMGEAEVLGLKVLADSEGPAEWLSEIAGRYEGVLQRVELENEILIMGIKPGDVERWTGLYRAVKDAAPQTEVFLTGAGANGMFDVLRDLGVPFDRVGLHAYKHGPEGKDAFSSHALGTGGYATSLGMKATLGEFNWKSLTRLSPEARREEFRIIFEEMLEPRAIPEFFQFHFQETISVNPSISRSGIRHYETISLDRRPKPEAYELMKLIRRYGDPDSPARELRIDVPEATFSDGRAEAPYTIHNLSGKSISLTLRTEAIGPVSSGEASTGEVTVPPGDSISGSVSLSLQAGAQVGTYHHFLVASYGGREAFGWGVAAYPGSPNFAAGPVLGDLVVYAGGPDIVNRVDWTRPLALAFGAEAPWLEMEMAYIAANTLQSATGRPVRVSSEADLPASFLREGTLLLVGTPETNPLIDPAQVPEGGTGIILLQKRTRDRPAALVLTGSAERGVQAAATDFVLRYWRNAKDAAIRIAGMEPGAGLGHRAEVTEPDPP